MKTYVLRMAGSGEVTEIHAESDADATRQATERLGNVVVCDSWDADGYNGDDQPCKRLLIWADEASAKNDAGANAIAQLSTGGAS
jgi:hypothetical protein